MKSCLSLALGASLLSLLGGGLCFSQDSQAAEKKAAEQAQREYAAGKFAEAERDFREVTKRDPSNLYAQVYLGQALFRQQKYAESIGPYEKVRELERGGEKLSSNQRRIVVDQLSMAYGISGDLTKARSLLEDAIRQDPGYPLNYYNLACVFADGGEKNKVLKNLSLAFQHKGNVLKGEQMPNPRTDSSFEKYAQDDDFIRLMKKLGYE